MIALFIVLAASAVAVYTDVTRSRIPNVLVAALLVSGLAVRASGGGMDVVLGIALFAIVMIAGLIPFSLRIIGGGDIKFIAAASAALGWPQAGWFIVFTLAAGGVLGIAVSAARGQLPATLRNLRSIVLMLFAGAKPAAPLPQSLKMPYALAIFSGVLCLVLSTIASQHVRFPL